MESPKRNLAQFRKLILFLFFCSNVYMLQAQVVISNLNSFSQDFSGLPQTGSGTWADNSTLSGWYAASDQNFSTTINASDGTNTSYGLKSYGSVSAADRALGCVTHAQTGSFYYGIRIKNNTGGMIKSFYVSYALEEWRDVNKSNPVFDIHYSKGTTVNSLTSGTWVAGTEANGVLIVNGNRGATDGNTQNCRIVINAAVNNIDLAAGDEIMLRWTDPNDNNNYIALDDVVITPSDANLYFNKTTGDLSLLSTWGAKGDGTGTAPLSFTGNYQHFVVKNTLAPTLVSAWAVSGTNSKLVVGDNTQAVIFTIPATYAFTGEIDVKDNAKLTINNATPPTLGILGTLSTVEYNNAANQALDEADYGILSIGTASKKLGGNIRIKNGLTFNNAKLELDAYDLTIEDGATITGSSPTAYISTKGAGKLKMTVKNNNTDVLFPVGTDTYLPVKIKQGAAATSDVFSVKAIDGFYGTYINNIPTAGTGLVNNLVNKSWIIDEAVIGGSNITMTLEWVSANTVADFDPTKARVVHYTNGSWDDVAAVGATVTNGRYSVSRSNITSFSPFGVTSGSPLPVELIRFEAKRTNNAIVCEWETASEKNSSYFSLERSTNGKEFVVIGKVSAAGNSTQVARYSFNDLQAPAGLVYYRLRQIDLDGTFTFSKIIAVNNAENKDLQFTLFPNPGADLRLLKANTAISGPVSIVVRNMQGQEIKTLLTDGSDLQAGLEMDMKNYARGIYFIEVMNADAVTILRAVQQ